MSLQNAPIDPHSVPLLAGKPKKSGGGIGKYVAGFLVALLLVVGVGAFIVYKTQSARSDQRMKSFGVDMNAENQWNKRWPSLEFPPRPSQTNVEKTYEKFEDYSSVSARFSTGTGWSINVCSTWHGNSPAPNEPPRTISFYGMGTTGPAVPIILIADGKRYASQSNPLGLVEISTEDLLAISRAKSIETNFHNYTLTDEDKQQLRDLLSMLKP